jgi:hypothetical protein
VSRYNFDDFTVKNYRALLRRAKSNYKFIRYQDACSSSTEPSTLWRHDIDASVHRALSLAEIEAEEGAIASYFVQISCNFYNIFEADVKGSLRKIQSLGHDIGLHFDPSCYQVNDVKQLVRWMDFEKRTLEDLLEQKVTIFSFHVPTNIPDEFIRRQYEGMTNVYSAEIVNRFKYCSDSNGYWRHDRLADVIDAKENPYLHVLTHPEYWTEDVMSPYEKIERCVSGRAKSTMARLDSIVASTGRKIPKLSDEGNL